MMFLEFFVWGAWFVTVGSYMGALGFAGAEIGTAYLTNNLAAIISPFFICMVADRYFSSQKVMGLLHLVGAYVMYLATNITDTWSLITMLFLYNICYMPTLALVNNIAFHHIEDPNKQFPKLRVWGTIGWIIAGLTISFLLGAHFDYVEQTAIPLKMAAFASFFLGIYSFALPDTPPKKVGKNSSIGEVLGLKAVKLMVDRSFTVFVICSLLISIPLAFYYSFTNMFLNDLGIENAAAVQSLGQVSEVIFMILMPWFFIRLGVKKMLIIGMLAWVLRYGLFATGDSNALAWMIFLGVLLHGICYDFFFVVGQIYVDNHAPKEIRASAQGFITLITYGVGIGLGSLLSGHILDLYTVEGIKVWSEFWLIPSAFAFVVTIAFVAFFQEGKKGENNTHAISLNPSD